jgi:hypothetical protein
VALKLEASNTAETDSRATERAAWSAQARVELFCCFFIELFRLNQFSYFPPDLAAQDCGNLLTNWKNPEGARH